MKGIERWPVVVFRNGELGCEQFDPAVGAAAREFDMDVRRSAELCPPRDTRCRPGLQDTGALQNPHLQ